MRAIGAAALIGMLQTVLAGHAAMAMQFAPVQIAPDRLVLGGRGPIVPGDADRLERALAALPRGQRLMGLALDSPGGSVLEGEKLATLIRANGLAVIIPSNSQCASACFLLFAAAPRRLAATDALIGVHSANERGTETETSMAVTTAMARDAAQMGVPEAIIGKMVTTTPGRVAWLTPADLSSMGVVIYDNDTAGATNEPAMASNRPMVPPVPVPSAPAPAAPSPASAFQAGRDDRRALTAWLGTLRGAYQAGAEAALTQHERGAPSVCTGPDGRGLGAYTEGCVAAWQRLALADDRARASADYRLGWNAETAAPHVPPASAVGQAEAEYHGAFFCGRQAARLTLRILAGTGGAPRRATFSFGPLPSGPATPSGSFIVEGTIDLPGGRIDVTPVSWVQEVPGYTLLGLNGHSEDGGRTFTGRVTASAACTVFTLRRAG